MMNLASEPIPGWRVRESATEITVEAPIEQAPTFWRMLTESITQGKTVTLRGKQWLPIAVVEARSLWQGECYASLRLQTL
jgi:hypothetical protein